MGTSLKPVIAVVQARTGSRRFPGKVLEPVLGVPMLLRQLERVSRAQTIDAIVVATTDVPADDQVVTYAEEAGYTVYRGSEDDVLERFRGAAKHAGAETVVRLTGDCPLIDPALIDAAVETYVDAWPNVDFVSNSLSETYPDGMDTEVFSRRLLERAARDATLPSEREHVTFYFWKSGLFRVLRIAAPENLGHLRLTVDYPEDLDLVRRVYERLYDRDPAFGLDAIVAVLAEFSTVPNAERRRNEGWGPSLARDVESR